MSQGRDFKNCLREGGAVRCMFCLSLLLDAARRAAAPTTVIPTTSRFRFTTYLWFYCDVPSFVFNATPCCKLSSRRLRYGSWFSKRPVCFPPDAIKSTYARVDMLLSGLCPASGRFRVHAAGVADSQHRMIVVRGEMDY